MSVLTIRRPDDWHLHLRDGAALASVVKFTAERFGRAIVMPNLKPPVPTTAAATAYQKRVLAALPKASTFTPLMTLYLTDSTVPEEIDRAIAARCVHGVKLYPAGATTHSDAGVTDIQKTYAVLERMEKCGIPLLVHGEAARPDVDVFDRESVFIDETLAPLIERFPGLKVVFEHITTARAVEFVTHARAGVAATITPQHLLHNRNAIFSGGIRPHYYCLPILKRERDRLALIGAATGGSPKFFLGTDSAPHERSTKENACGCAGMFTAHAAVELYAEAFESVGRLDRLEAFASHFGADFYGLPRHDDTITLVKEPWVPPKPTISAMARSCPIAAVKPLHGGSPRLGGVHDADPSDHLRHPLSRLSARGDRRRDRRLQFANRRPARNRRGLHRDAQRRDPGARRDDPLPRHPVSRRQHGSGVAGRERNRSPSSPAPRHSRRGCAAAHLPRSPHCHSHRGLHARSAGRAQRFFRFEFLERRRGSRPGQAQPLPSLLQLRYRHVGRRCIRADGVDAGDARRRPGMGHRL